MRSSAAVLSIYFILTLLLGLAFRRRSGSSIDEYYLAGRKVGGVLLFFTMAATNFSAFTIFGLSGAGYRMGYAFFPVMGFGTGFMVLSFIIIGKKVRSLSGRYCYITPADYIFHRYGSKELKVLVSAVLVFFTLPYIAIQAVAGGRSLEVLAGIPYRWGAALVTGFIVLYVVLGGMRSIVWTDLVQGAMMLTFTLAAFIIIAAGSGGFVETHRELLREAPGHFSRAGTGGVISPGVWFGYLFLWFFADPMFPQLFQRFLAAGSEKALDTTIILYPLVTMFLFFLTISIGVMGRGALPGLPAAGIDSIFPLLLRRYAGELLGTILLTGSLAALMSTMDSQLLSVTSMIQRDLLPAGSRLKGIPAGRCIVILLGAAGFLIALNPPEEILDFVNRTTFTGLSVLAPAVIGGLYWKRGSAAAAGLSIIAGEAMTVLFGIGVLSVPGVLPVLPVLGVTAGVYVLASLIFSSSVPADPALLSGFDRRLSFFLLFIAASSVPAGWNRPPEVLIAGLPVWVWWFFLLGVLLSTGLGVYLCRERGKRI